MRSSGHFAMKTQDFSGKVIDEVCLSTAQRVLPLPGVLTEIVRMNNESNIPNNTHKIAFM